MSTSKLIMMRIFCPNQKRQVNVSAENVSYNAYTCEDEFGDDNLLELIAYIPKCKCGKDHHITLYKKPSR